MAEKDQKGILNPRENNKTNRERREQEEKQTKLLKTGGAIVACIVVVCMIAGIILGIVNKPSRKVVATVGDEKITLDEFQSAVRLQRSNINSNYQYMKQLYSMFGMEMDANTKESYAMQMSDSYKGLLGQSVLSNMINQRVMAYGAAQEGIAVSDDEVEAYYKGMFGYYPDGTPTAAPTDEPFEATPTVTDEQLAILRYTETPLPTEIPTEELAEAVEEAVTDAVEQAEDTVDDVEETVADVVEQAEDTVDAVEETVADVVEQAEDAVEAVESEAEELAADTVDQVEEILSEPTSEPTLAPTPTVYTEDMFRQYESVYFANNFYYSKDFFKNELRYELLQNKVQENLKKDVARTADMVWARHILVETEEEAQAALDRINAGEEWGDVCAEVSTDSSASNGGDLGWFTEGTMVQPFNDAAFSQEVGTISDPVQTDYGWHLIQVIGHEERPLTSSQYNTAVETAYQNWLDGYSSQLDITMESVTDLTPTDPAFAE